MRIKNFIILFSLPCFLSLFPLTGYAGYILRAPTCYLEDRTGISDKAENIFYCDVNKKFDFRPRGTSHWVKIRCGSRTLEKSSGSRGKCHVKVHDVILKHHKSLKTYKKFNENGEEFSATNWSPNHTQALTVKRIYCRLQKAEKMCDKNGTCKDSPCLQYGDDPVPGM